jgi:hypothetical protein
MALITFDPPGTMQTGMGCSYEDVVNLLWRNALTLDAMSLRGRRAWTDQNYDLAAFGGNPAPLTRAAFQFRTGLTTLTIVAYGTNASSDTFRVWLNGVQVATAAATGADQTITVTLTGRGYTDYQIIEVEVDVTRLDPNIVGTYALRDAYVGPASGIVSASPGSTAFGAISAANINQLGAYQLWLFDRMNAVSMAVPQGQLYRGFNWWVTAPKMMWRGSVARGNGANLLTATVGYWNVNTPGEKMTLSISTGGAYTQVAETPVITPGQSGAYTFSVDISGYADAQRLHVKLEQVCTSGFVPARGAIAPAWSLRWVETTQAAWTYTTPLGLSSARESMAFSTLQTRLNSIRSACAAVESRISGSADMWDRIRLFRRSPTLDEFQASHFKLNMLARSRRYTDGLWLRGKNIKIGWGALSIEPERVSGEIVWKPQWEQQLIGDGAIEDRYIGFDTLPGLVGGSLYYLYGDDLRYAAEVWQ